MIFNSIQICRGIAALLVLLFHLGRATAHYFELPALAVPFEFGDAGVYFFFVLSGFVITLAHSKYANNPGKLSNYALSRVIRIYPTYWILFCLVLVMKLLLPQVGVPLADPLSILKGLALIPQTPLDGAYETYAPIIVVAWTLQYEMIFYLIFRVSYIEHEIVNFLSWCHSSIICSMLYTTQPVLFAI